MKTPKPCMDVLRRLAADTSTDVTTRIVSGERAIKGWASQVGTSVAEKRRMLEALDIEIASMAEADHFWSTMGDVVEQQLNALPDQD